MGSVTALEGKRVYIDANIVIYGMEGFARYREILSLFFKNISTGSQSALTSELTIAEVLVKPLLDGDQPARQRYERTLVSRGSFTVAPVDRRTLVEAALLRSRHRIKLPDAIHLSTAIVTGCEVFLTNDLRLASVGRVQVEALPNLEL